MAGCRSFASVASALLSGCRSSCVSPKCLMYGPFPCYTPGVAFRNSSNSGSISSSCSSRKYVFVNCPLAACNRRATAGSICGGLPDAVRPPRLLNSGVACSSFLSSMQRERFINVLQLRSFSSGMRNTKAGIKNPFWRRKGFWEWRRRKITKLNRQMRRRKHIFPRRELRYLPADHPLHAGRTAGCGDTQALFHSLEIQQAAETVAAVAAERASPGEGSSTGSVVGRDRRQRHRRKPGGFLHDGDNNAVYSEDMSYLSAPEKGRGRVWVAKRRDVPMGRKRLLLLLRLVKGLHLTDALDWLQALAIHRANALWNVLAKQQQKIRDEGADISRVFIDSYIIGPAGHVKTMRVGHNYRVSFLKSYRYSVAVRLRELPLHEYFHRLFILKQVPRSLGHDMRLALHQQQLPQEAARDWLPYLDAHTRSQHKRRLKVLDRQRLFNYYLARRAFVCSYTSRMRRMSEEAAASRGTSLEAVQTYLGSKSQLKGIDPPEN